MTTVTLVSMGITKALLIWILVHPHTQALIPPVQPQTQPCVSAPARATKGVVGAFAQQAPITACTCLGFYNSKNKMVSDTLRPISLVDGTRISDDYGLRVHPIFGYVIFHFGVDIAAPMGTPVYAIADGVVQVAGQRGGYGNYVRVQHSKTLVTAYAHLSRVRDGVYPGARVKRGEVLGYVGSTGLSTGNHLHFEVISRGIRVKPMCVCNSIRSSTHSRTLTPAPVVPAVSAIVYLELCNWHAG